MMSLVSSFRRELWQNVFCYKKTVTKWSHALLSTTQDGSEISSEATNYEQKTESTVATTPTVFREGNKPSSRARFMYPEFLPDPKFEWRNPIREKLERMDMMKRRSQIDIPEFYVGSILAVTSSTPHAPNKISKFVGICIQRSGCGLRAQFVLRNVIDQLGTEIVYRIYDPTIQKIDVLRLEKRLDNELFYLRDALPEYSTFPLDMEVEFLPEGSDVPVNDVKVKLKSKPWTQRWDLRSFNGIADIPVLTPKQLIRRSKNLKPWEKYDLMKQYRLTIPEEEQNEIFAEVYSELHQLELLRKKIKRKRMFVKPVKTS
ncbi:large ribosomal subunit protein bL19m-like [Lycorma delicatula]|uniref:large ribosomal subunit protein bL19m-like n=1 Tax=Lycorma delicatula TaxID=130591 RepID=UPI003F50E7AB